MKNLILYLATALLTYNQANAQNDSTQLSNCDFLNSIKFKNGIAKIKIKAITNEVSRMSDMNILKKLEKEGKLRAKDFGYAVVFRPIGCSKTYYISSRDHSKNALSLFKLGGVETNITITCIVFENYKLWDYPFFIIDKVQIN